ncbi:hypothetical protein CRG98_022376 [Punica granatum]|uniref:Uncharacterized protein n=1 Tax=Punica granatum TaxID=22663 RepID=A0A2I0JLS3_PUNGR|nr:hypothetical protein CRG98_022376 [Punica granatum]
MPRNRPGWASFESYVTTVAPDGVLLQEDGTRLCEDLKMGLGSVGIRGWDSVLWGSDDGTQPCGRSEDRTRPCRDLTMRLGPTENQWKGLGPVEI